MAGHGGQFQYRLFDYAFRKGNLFRQPIGEASDMNTFESYRACQNASHARGFLYYGEESLSSVGEDSVWRLPEQ